MEVTVFMKNDDAFIAWRDGNSDSFILNIPYPNARDDREYYLAHVKLHHADCVALRPNRNGEKPWTTKHYFKVCGDDPSEVAQWLTTRAHTIPGWSVPLCKVCGGD